MKVLFVSRKQSARFISRKLIHEGDEHLFFCGVYELLKGFDFESDTADILLLDHDFFEECRFYFFEFLKGLSARIPFVFYNTPSVSKENRVIHWIFTNESFFEYYNFDYLIPFFTELASCLDSEPEQNSNYRNVSECDELMLSLRDVPPSLFRIFSYFRDNSGREISLSELVDIGEDTEKTSTVYSYISRLRKIMAHRSPFRILRTGKSRYRLFRVER